MDISETSKTVSSRKNRAISTEIRIIGAAILCLIPILMTSSTPPTLLEKVQQSGFLQVISFNGPVTYYEGRFGHAGFEYELTKAFADSIGVELTITDVPSLKEIISDTEEARGHFAAAGLTILDERKEKLYFSTPYSTVTQKVIYRRGNHKPRVPFDIVGQKIIVAAESPHIKSLEKMKAEHPKLRWKEIPNVEMTDLLEMVHKGEADITLVDSSAFIANQPLYPRARKAFDITEPEDVAWAFPKREDQSLLNAANTFLTDYMKSGELKALEKKYFTKPPIDEGGALSLSKRIDKRLPQWVPYFKEAAEEHNLDWLFLAAMSYQESLWNKDAKSFTGVRGLMMLTKVTAKSLGIKDRTDPRQSILGGARYLMKVHKRIPKDIKEPDRTWMALAAYNVGFGHLEDARIITQKQGKNPDKWDNVKQYLPWLSKKRHYSRTRHGYARGSEPVHYVENIRGYHKILIWYYNDQQRQFTSELKEKPYVDVDFLPQI